MSDGWYDRFDRMFGERDGRLVRKTGEKYGTVGPLPSQLFERVFCYCGADGGYVTKGTPVIYICQKCTNVYGNLPLPVVPGTEDM